MMLAHSPASNGALNVTGVWSGDAKDIYGSRFIYRFNLRQDGDTITGTTHKIYVPQPNGLIGEAVINIRGTVADGQAVLAETGTVRRNTPNAPCLFRRVVLSPASGGLSAEWNAPPCAPGKVVLMASGVF